MLFPLCVLRRPPFPPFLRTYFGAAMRRKQSRDHRASNTYSYMNQHLEDGEEDGGKVGPYKARALRERNAKGDTRIRRYLERHKIGAPVTSADKHWVKVNLKYRQMAPEFLGQIRPLMRFMAAAIKVEQMPLAHLPEVAVTGRSNVGKSTLLNALTGRGGAYVEKKPGSTSELVFWKINKPALLCLVDMPGYGFAFAKEEKRMQWSEMCLWYIKNRKNLKRVLLLVDVRMGISEADREMMSFLDRHKVSWQPVATKCDFYKPKFLAKKLTVMQEEIDKKFLRAAGPIIPLSAKMRQGISALRLKLDQLKMDKKAVLSGIEEKVFDLLEARRIRREQKRKRRKENLKLKALESVPDPEQGRMSVRDTLMKWGIMPDLEGGAREAEEDEEEGGEALVKTGKVQKNPVMASMLDEMEEKSKDEEEGSESEGDFGNEDLNSAAWSLKKDDKQEVKKIDFESLLRDNSSRKKKANPFKSRLQTKTHWEFSPSAVLKEEVEEEVKREPDFVPEEKVEEMLSFKSDSQNSSSFKKLPDILSVKNVDPLADDFESFLQPPKEHRPRKSKKNLSLDFDASPDPLKNPENMQFNTTLLPDFDSLISRPAETKKNIAAPRAVAPPVSSLAIEKSRAGFMNSNLPDIQYLEQEDLASHDDLKAGLREDHLNRGHLMDAPTKENVLQQRMKSDAKRGKERAIRTTLLDESETVLTGLEADDAAEEEEAPDYENPFALSGKARNRRSRKLDSRFAQEKLEKKWYEAPTGTGYISRKNFTEVPKGTLKWKVDMIGKPRLKVAKSKEKTLADVVDAARQRRINAVRAFRTKGESWKNAKARWMKWAKTQQGKKRYDIIQDAITAHGGSVKRDHLEALAAAKGAPVWKDKAPDRSTPVTDLQREFRQINKSMQGVRAQRRRTGAKSNVFTSQSAKPRFGIH